MEDESGVTVEPGSDIVDIDYAYQFIARDNCQLASLNLDSKQRCLWRVSGASHPLR